LKWLGVFDPSLKIMRNVAHVHNFAAHLQTKMNYLPGETDLVAMQHIFKIVYYFLNILVILMIPEYIQEKVQWSKLAPKMESNKKIRF